MAGRRILTVADFLGRAVRAGERPGDGHPFGRGAARTHRRGAETEPSEMGQLERPGRALAARLGA